MKSEREISLFNDVTLDSIEPNVFDDNFKFDPTINVWKLEKSYQKSYQI